MTPDDPIRELDEAPLGCYDRIRAFFATAAFLGIGVFGLRAPPEMREDLPEGVLTWIGYGGLGFGALYGLTAFFASGRSAAARAITARLRGLIFATLGGGVAVFLAWTVGRDLHETWRLADHGRPAAGIVSRLGRTPGFQGGGGRSFQIIDYDGHHGRVHAASSLRIGDSLAVLYLPEAPAVVVPGTAGDDFLTLVDHGPGWKTAAIGVGLFLFCLLFGVLLGLKRFFFGRGRPAQGSSGPG